MSVLLDILQVHKLLGKGSYGKVYKVEREGDKQMYALKEADLGAMSQAERADAVNEVRLMVSMSHPNVVSSLQQHQPGDTTLSQRKAALARIKDSERYLSYAFLLSADSLL